MTKQDALVKASRQARERECMMYVVLEDGYHVADDYDMDTFFLGMKPIAAYGSDGKPQW